MDLVATGARPTSVPAHAPSSSRSLKYESLDVADKLPTTYPAEQELACFWKQLVPLAAVLPSVAFYPAPRNGAFVSDSSVVQVCSGAMRGYVQIQISGSTFLARKSVLASSPDAHEVLLPTTFGGWPCRCVGTILYSDNLAPHVRALLSDVSTAPGSEVIPCPSHAPFRRSHWSAPDWPLASHNLPASPREPCPPEQKITFAMQCIPVEAPQDLVD